MMELDFPTRIEQLREGDCELLFGAVLRGFTLDMLARCFADCVHATGAIPPCREVLRRIERGEFDHLLFSNGQSLS